MQQGERERLELEFKQKARDYQFQSKELNEAKAVADREMLKQLKPKLDSAVEEVNSAIRETFQAAQGKD